ncbi:MAG: aldo/keto reductase [Candidatus Abyssobacteria bacterium SURF_17]|uniref:Aldo/keto reductase n=1 Tax=Candidatus Abyssobacteria bacterium SURF_17 TaxID=2093361 RepID=A0A419EUR8_9BACT|nr:MAG: aldo/keto reductase [Candidatus Abyssubacteria bacterium SURF_17]
MRVTTLGKTGLRVSALGFGGIPIIRLVFDDAVHVVRHCFEGGITFFDTANVYGDSEKKIGTALESVRDKVVFATKTLARDAETAAEHVNYSLENLKTSRIELYQLHNLINEAALDTVLAPGGAYEAVKKARDDGRIAFIGFSSHHIPTAIKACRTGLFATVQFPFNFIERDPADELFKVAEEMNMGIIAMKPLGGGLLERADLCFGFLQQYPNVIPIPGIQAKKELDEIVALYRSPKPLAEADRKEIERIRAELGTKFCHRCEYCMPCEKGVMIPNVLGFRSFSRRLAPMAAIAMAEGPMQTVENCEECQECVEKCPYDLPIPDLLKEGLSLYKDFVKQHG